MPIDAYFRTRRLPMTWQTFEALPRCPGYKIEHLSGETFLTPRDDCARARLLLAEASPASDEPEMAVRRLVAEDWALLVPTFAHAFRCVPPFETLDDDEAEAALRECLEATRRGEDGPLIEPACLVADGRPETPELRGALLVTLLPGREGGGDWRWQWRQPPPPDAVERRLGRPHLTWVFVHPFARRRGVASALLVEAAAALRRLGFAELASTTLAANVSSVLWHWRQGFRLLPAPWRGGSGG